MQDKVLQFCQEQGLVTGESVVCAVSGGADSMAMLCCLRQLQPVLGITVSAAHFNHKLRGADSEQDECFVRKFCMEQGIALTVGQGDVSAYAAQHKLSIESAARQLRYDFLQHCGGLVATAHTADDNAETVLLNLTRGAGIRGLSGIPPKRGQLIRPLLCVTREDVVAYLTDHQIPWREDQSNQHDDYRRNRLRHHVLPLLRQENPALSDSLTLRCRLLRAEDDYLEQAATQAIMALRRDGGYDCAAFSGLHEAMQRRVIRQLVAADARHTEEIRRMLRSDTPTGRQDLPDGRCVRRAYGVFRVESASVPTWTPLPLPTPGLLTLPTLGLSIRTWLTDTPRDFSAEPDTLLLNYGMIAGEIVLRPRQIGDMLALPGGRKSIKRLMIDRKIPASHRGCLPVLESGGQVLAVRQIGVSREYLPQPGSTLLVVQFEEQKENEENRHYEPGH